jgi:stress response protein YsnF
VTEEEVVVEKRPVVKEELRIRKDVVEDEEVVEEDVRREEVDVEDQTERAGGRLGRDTDPGDEETRRRSR